MLEQFSEITKYSDDQTSDQKLRGSNAACCICNFN